MCGLVTAVFKKKNLTRSEHRKRTIVVIVVTGALSALVEEDLLII